jgi:hypothetical protein
MKTSEEFFNLTERLNEKENSSPLFLNLVNELQSHGTSLFENFQHLANLELLFVPHCHSEQYSFYEYAPFENYESDLFNFSNSDNREVYINSLRALKHYHIEAIYNIRADSTVGELKEKLLTPIFNNLFKFKTTLASLLFLNRLSEERVTLEVFLFSLHEIDQSQLSWLLFVPARVECVWSLLVPEKYSYWYYRLYCELFLNKNVLSGNSLIFSFCPIFNKEDMSKQLGYITKARNIELEEATALLLPLTKLFNLYIPHYYRR